MGGRDEIVGAELKIGSWFEKLKLNFTTSVSYTMDLNDSVRVSWCDQFEKVYWQRVHKFLTTQQQDKMPKGNC